MKKLYLAALLLSSHNGIRAMEDSVKLASAYELKKTLCAAGFGHFVEITAIDKTLGGKEIHPVILTQAINLASAKYGKSFNNPMADRGAQERTPKIITTLLQGHPHAIEMLKNQALLPRVEKDIFSMTL